MKQLFRLNEADHEIGLTRPDGRYRLLLDGGSHPVSLEPLGRDRYRLEVHGQACEVMVMVQGDFVHVHLDGATHSLRWIDPVTRFASGAGGAAGDVALAPMPGTVVALFVQPGQAVADGHPLLVIESMKLETTIRATRSGRVEAVHVTAGGTFARGAPLVSLAALGEEA